MSVDIITPAFSERNIPVCFYSSNYYSPFCGIAVYSLIANSSPNYNYDIIILSNDISDKNKSIINDFTKDKSNISIRFINFKDILEKLPFYTHGYLSIETYSRIFVMSSFFKSYDRIITLDSDMIIENDIANLYNYDLSDNYIGAVTDISMNASVKMNWHMAKPFNRMPISIYVRKFLDIESENLYFNAGTIVYDLKKCRQDHKFKQLFQLLNKNNFAFLDQDALNIAFFNHVRFIEGNWNVLVNTHDVKLENADENMYQQYSKSIEEPYILHFLGSNKPWVKPDIPLAERFFYYARKTPFYDNVIHYLASSAVAKDKFSLTDFIFPVGSKRSKIVRRTFYDIHDKFYNWK